MSMDLRATYRDTKRSHFAAVAFFPETQGPSLVMRKASVKPKLKYLASMAQEFTKVVKNKESLKSCHRLEILDWIPEEKEDINGKIQ